jgi:hypothetical protein
MQSLKLWRVRSLNEKGLNMLKGGLHGNSGNVGGFIDRDIGE